MSAQQQHQGQAICGMAVAECMPVVTQLWTASCTVLHVDAQAAWCAVCMAAGHRSSEPRPLQAWRRSHLQAAHSSGNKGPQFAGASMCG